MTLSDWGIPHVGWLTMLGAEPVKTLGGYAALAKQAGGVGVQCDSLADGGATLQAGEQLSPGDVNRGDDLPLQHAVGRLIEPVRISDEDIQKAVWIDGFKREEAQAWVKRFFGGWGNAKAD
jgi:hypothetical protein